MWAVLLHGCAPLLAFLSPFLEPRFCQPVLPDVVMSGEYLLVLRKRDTENEYSQNNDHEDLNSSILSRSEHGEMYFSNECCIFCASSMATAWRYTYKGNSAAWLCVSQFFNKGNMTVWLSTPNSYQPLHVWQHATPDITSLPHAASPPSPSISPILQ